MKIGLLTMKLLVVCFVCIELALGCGPRTEQCRRRDINVNKCIIKQIEARRSLLQNVSIELHSLKAEASLQLTTFISITPNIDLTDLIVTQTSNFKIEHLNVNLHRKQNMKGDMKVIFPQMNITADYHIYGRMVDGTGKLSGILDEVEVTLHSSARTYRKHGMIEYLQLKKEKIEVSIGNGQLFLQRTDSSFLGGMLVDYAENNSNEILKKLTPAIQNSVTTYFKKHVSNLLSSIPLKYMLND